MLENTLTRNFVEQMQSRPFSKVSFGIFEVDLQTGELRRSGIRIKIQSQPFQVLSILLERPGEVVSRGELQQRLWGGKITVDFDHSLGTAIKKIREALGDSAENPRFVETLARRGYRFIAPVTPLETLPPTLTSSDGNGTGSKLPRLELEGPIICNADRQWDRWQTKLLWGVGAAIVLLTIVSAGLLARLRHYPSPVRMTQVTFSGRVSPGEPLLESFPGMVTDGTRVFFPSIENGRAVLSQSLIGIGDVSILGVPSSIAAPLICDISPDGSKLLVRNHLAPEAEQSLWIVPALGGTARRVSNILAHDATWLPDGKRILYASGNDLLISREDGGDVHAFAHLPGRAFWLRWSPDGKRLRFTLLNSKDHSTALWQLQADGTQLSPLLPHWSNPPSECCGNWTADSKYYIFQSNRDTRSNLWGMAEDSFGLFGATVFQITNGPLSYQAPVPARSGHGISFLGLETRFELLHYDTGSRQFLPYRNELESAGRTEFSRDGQWVAWINPGNGSVWRSRTNGKELLQLTAPPLQVFLMHWSPDDKQLALMARMPGQPWKVYLVSADGGNPDLLLKEDRNEADPDWSPDGAAIVFGRLPDLMSIESMVKDLSIFNLQTKQLTSVPDSQGLFSPRWSPDGAYIAATSLDQHKLMVFEMAKRKWTVLATQSVADPVWAHDGKSIFFHSFMEEGQPICRAFLSLDRRVETVAGLRNIEATDIVDYSFSGLAPGDVPLLKARRWMANIYSLNLDWSSHVPKEPTANSRYSADVLDAPYNSR